MTSPARRASAGSPMVDLAAVVTAFGRRLHDAGVPVTPERSARFLRAIAIARPRTTAELADLGRVTLLSDRSQREVFDRIFDHYYGGTRLDAVPALAEAAPPPGSSARGEAEESQPETEGVPAQGGVPAAPRASLREVGIADDELVDHRPVAAIASADERLGHKDFATCSPDELRVLQDLAERLPMIPPTRKARRKRRAASGEALDLRATLRRAHRSGGDPVHLVYRSPQQTPRRLVLIADVSGSMEPYARVYLHLMRGAVRALRAEAFVFATRLTRITRALAVSDPDQAYRRAAVAAPDWSGGTRIGPALQRFVDDHGRRGMARGAVVVIVSDGWERGDAEGVRRPMEQLSRLAHTVIWVNPRKAARDYRPLVGGMAAALPYVDVFVSGHSLSAIEEVLAAIRSAARTSAVA